MSGVYCWSMGVVDSPEGYSVILDIGRYGTIKQNRQCQKDALIIDIRSYLALLHGFKCVKIFKSV